MIQANLITRLYAYLRENHPDLLFALQKDGAVTSYLQQKLDSVQVLLAELERQDKPAYIMAEVCLSEMTKDLVPSKFNYILQVLEEEFETTYNRFTESGILTYEVINMVDACMPVFDTLGFNEATEDNRPLYNAVTGTIHDYLTNSQ